MAYRMIVREPGGVEQFAAVEMARPEPAAGEILMRHTAIGLNFIDVYHRTGLYPMAQSRDFTPGGEAVGIVEAVGAGVTIPLGARVGTVFGGGAYASHRVIPAQQAVVLPDAISDEVAAAVMLKGLTANYLITHSYPVRAGETVLVHAAAGGVGLILGQWLAALGVRAIGTAGGAAKCALARAHGYAEVIDYRAQDFVAEVRRLTQGAGVPVVYDSVGRDTVMRSLDVLQSFGTLVSFGQSSGPVTEFKITDLTRGSLRLTRPTLVHHVAQAGWLAQASEALFAQIIAGRIKVEIGARFALSDVAAAHSALEGRQTSGSTVLIP